MREPSVPSHVNVERFPPIPEAELTDAQRELASVYRAGWRQSLAHPNGSLGGPLDATLRSPGFARAFMAVSDYMRSGSNVPADLKELTILMAARKQKCSFQWHSHAFAAEETGLSRDAVRAVRDQRRPHDLTEVQAATYDAVNELLETQRISDWAFQTLKERVGPELLIDIVGIAGYYMALAMILNTAQVVHHQPVAEDLPAFGS
jgi:4-carboxymuconolactone decarboxylase